jgi:hypothetical protein
MDVQEIVAAIIDSLVTTDVRTIDAFKSLGKHVIFVTRREARLRADRERSDCWGALAIAPTLYVKHDGILFRPL